MAHLRASQTNDKKRQEESWRSNKKKGGKKAVAKTGNHVNKYQQFSKADAALASHLLEKENLERRAAEKAREESSGWRRTMFW